MKKLMSILLCVTLLLGVCAAANAANRDLTIRHLLSDDGEVADYEKEITRISDYLNAAKNGHDFSRLCEDMYLTPIEEIDSQADKVNKIIEEAHFDLATYVSALTAAEKAVAEIKNVDSLEPDDFKFSVEVYINRKDWRAENYYDIPTVEKLVYQEYSASKDSYLGILKELNYYIDGLKNKA